MVAAHLAASAQGGGGDVGTGSKKRKGATGTEPPSGGRVTRRSLAAASLTPGAGPSTANVEVEEEDTARAVKRTLVGGADEQRRARKSSPSPVHPSNISTEPIVNAIASSSKDVLDPSLVDAAPPPQPRPTIPQLPYPIGLTPYRFECFLPNVPPPPPGDPNAPGFKPFNPMDDRPSSSLAAAQAPPGSFSAAGPSSNLLSTHNAPHSAAPHLPSASTIPSTPPTQEPTQAPTVSDPLENFQFPPDFNPSDLDLSGVDFLSDPAYASIAALLSASQLPEGLDPPNPPLDIGAYPRTPGERPDGKTGALAPELVGQYAIGSKVDCEECRTGAEGHVGHWLRSMG